MANYISGIINTTAKVAWNAKPLTGAAIGAVYGWNNTDSLSPSQQAVGGMMGAGAGAAIGLGMTGLGRKGLWWGARNLGSLGINVGKQTIRATPAIARGAINIGRFAMHHPLMTASGVGLGMAMWPEGENERSDVGMAKQAGSSFQASTAGLVQGLHRGRRSF